MKYVNAPESLRIYAEALSERGLPVIFGIEHFSKLVGFKTSAIRSMMYGQNKFYMSFTIQKRNGGKRCITAPFPSLLEIQRWIASSVLNTYAIHSAAHGYVCGRSTITNALPHCGAECILKMDLKDFFPTITSKFIFPLFIQAGYTNHVANILTRLCTLDGCTPQGAATSPCLSNIIFYRLDVRITALAKRYNLNYTRYADDLCFSGRYIPINFISVVKEIIKSGGFTVNSAKTKLIRQNGKKIVTGVSVATDKPKLPKSTKRLWRAEINSVLNRGVLEHCRIYNESPIGFLLKLDGKIAHWHNIEKDNNYIKNTWPKIKELVSKDPGYI